MSSHLCLDCTSDLFASRLLTKIGRPNFLYTCYVPYQSHPPGFVIYFGRSTLMSNLSNVSETLYGIPGKVNLWPYLNQALLCVSMAENPDGLASFIGNLAYRIL
jgi:hypothetical protein